MSDHETTSDGGDAFIDMLVRWPVPVLRVVLRTAAIKWGLPVTPVIQHGERVWQLDPTDSRVGWIEPASWHLHPMPSVRLREDGPLIPVWPASELAAACELMCDSTIDPPPPAPEPVGGSHLIAAGSALRDQHVLLAQHDLEQATTSEAASLLSVLTVCLHHQQRIVERLRVALATADAARHTINQRQMPLAAALRHAAAQLGPAQKAYAELQDLLAEAHRPVIGVCRSTPR
ncbi:hypothetical protein [Longispora albida]|uniref:hypothetical protein n=1 Tax=Longispora albida TaxID=203523 RepID=UPI00037D8E16|nr:hypothetical protein [Longispora albida]